MQVKTICLALVSLLWLMPLGGCGDDDKVHKKDARIDAAFDLGLGEQLSPDVAVVDQMVPVDVTAVGEQLAADLAVDQQVQLDTTAPDTAIPDTAAPDTTALDATASDTLSSETSPDGGSSISEGAVLSGAQETPPVATAARGTAMTVINPSRSAIAVTVAYTGLGNITAAHIHLGALGKPGPVLFILANSSFTSPLTKALSQADLLPQPAYQINTFAEAVQAIERGECYVNIHTTAYPGGEIRGQIGPIAVKVLLSGGSEVPPVMTTASGEADLAINDLETQINVRLSYTGLTAVQAAHIHVGLPGTNGPVIFMLASSSFASPLDVTLQATDLTPQAAEGIITFQDAVNAILSGRAYINVHTAAHPDGEIRGDTGL